ncbi:MAG: hypothetical protein ACI94Y_001973 [Maribacter sp.]|jgi:hypothetical protein
MSTFKQGHALIIGIGNDLPITERDATDIAKVFADPSKAGYLPENVEVLTGKDATRANIEKGLDKLIANTKGVKGATAVVYYSGHGAQLPWLNNEQRYFLVPNDVNFDDIDTFLPSETFTDKINSIEADKLLVLLDCCHAEGQHITEKSIGEAQEKSLGKRANAPIVSKLNGGEGKVFIASCKDDEKSYISFGDSNSLFTKHLVTALNGAKSIGYNYIHVLDIISHLFRMVPNEAKIALNKDQTPIINFADKLDANFFISANNNVMAKNANEIIKSKSLDQIEAIRRDIISNYNVNIHNTTTNNHNNTNNAVSGDGNIITRDGANIVINHNYSGNNGKNAGNKNNNDDGNIPDYLSKAKKHIGKGSADKAIDLLIDNAPDDYTNALIIQSSRWNSAKKQETMGTASQSQINMTKNQIINALLSIISDIKEED